MSVPADRRYLETHEWHQLSGDVVTIGLTQHAADELTDITFVQLPKVGSAVVAGKPFGEIESVKATADLMAGVSGQVVAVNDALATNPGVVNQDPYAGGWMIRVKVADTAQMNSLLSAEDYQKEERALIPMDYTQITTEQRQQMLKAVGAAGMQDLLKQVPEQLRMKRPLDLPPAMDELTLQQHLADLSSRNAPAGEKVCFLGAGAYDHFIPAVVDSLAGKGEFVTAYTPYQPEASQGSLQAFFEFQTMVCQLAGMDIANASLYEGASALAEAVMMAAAASGKRQILVSRGVSPDYRHVLRTYLSDLPAQYVELALDGGLTDIAELEAKMTPDTAAVAVQSPNFTGLLEDVAGIAGIAHGQGAAVVQVFNPISVGIMKRPGDQGADVAVAEGQPLGMPLSFGGPYLGLFAARGQFLRRMPGRLVGQTVDAEGRRAFCLTLQTREQHIRREKATSNVCTNQGLMALRASIYMAAMGPQGLRQVAQLCHNKASYFAAQVQAGGLKLKFPGKPLFNEVLVELKRPVDEVLKCARDAGVLAGHAVEKEYPELTNCLLVALTENRTRAEVDGLVDLLK